LEKTLSDVKKKIRFLALDIDGVLTDGGMYYSESGDEFKKFNTKDGMGIKLIQNHGILVGFLSSGKNVNLITNRAKLLNVQYIYVGYDEKLNILEQWCVKLGISLDDVAYIGDDVNDLNVISAVGFSASPSDAVEKVKAAVDVVLQNKGGEACVREFIDTYLLPS
jgi:3-deoxy-D-manno-octulosonate 8-phosphate phosphatase (KDO 8-P phosphatase)